MRDFFKGWRRKAGVATLALACVFTVWWVRSLSVQDNIWIRLGDLNTTMFSSVGGHFAWVRYFLHDDNDAIGFFQWNTLEGSKFSDYFEWSPVVQWSHPLFTYLEYENSVVCVVPAWCIVLPLTLLSAYMLLSKPRPAKQPDPTQPTEPDHA